ncbi:MAG: hypothetical protein OEV42_20575 [Deltaproteobacteria bacterium]|nr:hypothetical protein [Deltaproteobacteria bacterium]
MSTNNNICGYWGLYLWFDEHGVGLIHPEDIEKFRKLVPNGKVFECVDDDGQYITLKYADMRYRVLRNIFKPVKEPVRKIGEQVKLRESSTVATIVDIEWHFKKNTHIYFIEIEGKRKSKRYWIEDFET